MPIRLVIALLLVLFEGAFIGFNLENTCNVWFFKAFETVPVYITALISFAAGIFTSILLFAFGKLNRVKRKKKLGSKNGALKESASTVHSEPSEISFADNDESNPKLN